MNRRTLLSSLPLLASCRARRPHLYVFNWSNYLGDDTLRRFESETGIGVRYSVYESNEEMLARVMGGNSGFDVVFPTHYFIEPMRQMDLLAPLDRAQLRNLANLDEMFSAPVWDPRLEWSVPYMWGSSGILFNPARTVAIHSWDALWNPALAGSITMLDDPAEVLGACLKRAGRSINSTSESELHDAKRDAMRQKPLLRAYLNAEVRDQMVAGDLAACQLWATTAQQAIDAAPALRFAYPSEGYPLYADCAVILKESHHPAEAHRFIDFLLRPDVAAAIVTHSRTATANATARRLLPAAVSSLETLYPSPETLHRGEWFAAMPPHIQRLRDRIWTEIKSS